MIPDALTIAVWAAERRLVESRWTFLDLTIDWQAYKLELEPEMPTRFCAEAWAFVGVRFWGDLSAEEQELLP